MTIEGQEASSVQQTEHPYIVRVAGVCDGRPLIKGTRISVRHIAQSYKAGDTVEEILQAHPHLKAAAVHDAISYYLDHQPEIEQEIRENRLEGLLTKYGLERDERGFCTSPIDRVDATDAIDPITQSAQRTQSTQQTLSTELTQPTESIQLKPYTPLFTAPLVFIGPFSPLESSSFSNPLCSLTRHIPIE
jgi:uncharacterized protein (DUF433 family)